MNAAKYNDRFEAVENHLFFIVGCGRSGSSLLRSILDAHSNLSLPHETSFFTRISYGSFGVGDKTLQQKLQVIMDKWWIGDMSTSAAAITEQLGEREPSWRNLFVSFLASLPNDSNVNMFGEKTIRHIDYVHQLLEAYPKCRIIQIIRDPRASFASFRRVQVGSNQVSKFAKDWRAAVEVDRTLEGNERYFRVKFEDLVAGPEEASAAICRFLSVAYDPGMMKFHERETAGFSPEQVHHQNTRKPVFQSSIAKWKEELSNTHIGLLESCLGEHMERLGYELTGATVVAPGFQMAISSAMEWCSKQFIRRPRQLLKKLRAKRRQAKS